MLGVVLCFHKVVKDHANTPLLFFISDPIPKIQDSC